MAVPESVPPAGGEAGGWILLGILNEILLKLVSQADERSLWQEVCASARWILPALRFCVVLKDGDDRAEVAARFAAGAFQPGPLETDAEELVLDASMRSALQAQRAGWFKGPWTELREVDPLRGWLLADNPDAVFYVPILVYHSTIGAMFFALSDQAKVDRKALASATTFALYVGATYTMLKGSLELAAAGERLRAQNDELERVHLDLLQQLDLVRTQHDAMMQMSTPIIQVWDSVLTLPVIGTVDRARAARMMEEVLAAIVREQARFMILDLTGAETTDASTVQHLLRLFAAAKLLGSQCIVSGVPPAMIAGILEVGGNLGGAPVFSTLKRALEHVMKAMGAQRR